MEKDKVSAEDRIYGVNEEDDRYYCPECHYEIPVGGDCPGCKRRVNWDKVYIEIHRIIP